MFDVLAYLLEEFNDPAACPERDDLGRQLAAAGFENEEISDALDWLDGLNQLNDGSYDGADAGSGFRCFSEQENARLSGEIRGLILFLEHNGALSPAQREMLIDRLLAMPDDEISLPSAKLAALMVLWAQGAELPILLGEDLLCALHGEPTMQ
ncbi:DUF494 family protein [Vogesella indigofera]|jgi:Smg protein|uniref:Protein Smg homolog n=1 Tax=Vogesella indigofera TaxID=45465 RepID=A0A495BJT2_VOGIN|nr:DUF494 domain-containing protein [Vogesella indigofera]MDC7696921.1 DUF494 domain-containing protein [Vogesella indigofera]MDC7706430.1 DUF494 domain-containing protein [Vogesella indigofera]RKQ60016.1 Smg protein [Vogesella indigofera]